MTCLYVPPIPESAGIARRWAAPLLPAATKLRWQLTADDRELEALKAFAEGPCEDTIVRYTQVA